MTMLILSNKVFRRLLSGCVAATLALAASQVQGVQDSTQQRQAKAVSRLQKEVRHVLVTQPFYTVFDNLAFKTDGDRVTLLGLVVTPTLKSDAADAVKSIEGVAAVDNQIEVLPVSPIHIIVNNGHVTLVGVVANNADKILANARANSVSGVFSVTSDLAVEK